MNPTAAQRERVLDSWASGLTGGKIAACEKIPPYDVSRIVRQAQKSGDPRAVNRGGNGQSVDQHEFFPKTILKNFDYAFKTAMLAAIAAGEESPPIGVFKAAPKKKSCGGSMSLAPRLTPFELQRIAPFRDFSPTDSEILREWRLGKNTAEIASAYFRREAEIANRLPRILEDARQAERLLCR